MRADKVVLLRAVDHGYIFIQFFRAGRESGKELFDRKIVKIYIFLQPRAMHTWPTSFFSVFQKVVWVPSLLPIPTRQMTSMHHQSKVSDRILIASIVRVLI